MRISRSTLQNGLYIGLAMLFVAMIGMLTVFSERYIIFETLTLSTLILFGIFMAAGYYAVRRLENCTAPNVALNGAVAGGIVALILAALAFVASQIDLTGIFINVTPELINLLASGQESLATGLLILVATGVGFGALGGLGVLLPARIRNTALYAALLLAVIGMLQDQINTIIALGDAVVFVGLILVGYVIGLWRKSDPLRTSLLIAVGAGAALGLVLALVLASGANGTGAPQLFGGPLPNILRSLVAGRGTVELLLLSAVVGAALSTAGAALSSTSGSVHTSGVTILTSLLVLGVLHSAGRVTREAAVVMLVILVVGRLITERAASQSAQRIETMSPRERRVSQGLIAVVGLIFVLIIPQLMTQYINNVLDLVGLYVMLGLGLNIIVGYSGMLNLGYVAFFAIGAYATGVMMTPNPLTCGGLSPADIPAADIASICTGVTTFWLAWPAAVLVCGVAGVLLALPVLGLRGDYLAIVTLGFGEIIRLITLSDVFKPILGGAQGITNVPPPTIDLTSVTAGGGMPLFVQPYTLTAANQVYYLILIGIILTVIVSSRLSGSRIGRSWRAMKEDETVAQAMGINLVRTKLLAFSIGTAFAGVAGAIFASYLRSIFPNSFTLLVSINVLSLIIIGGMGSIPGVFVGALIIFGLPEALREFQEFRLLMFGALLVVTMLLRPSGVIPPSTPRLEEQGEKVLAYEGGKAKA